MSYIVPNNVSLNNLTASNHVSASYFYGDGSGLSNIATGGLTSVSTNGNITGSGTSLDPVGIKPDPLFNTVTASVVTASDVITDYVNFNSNADPLWDNGRMWYNNTTHELNYWTEVDGFNIKIGQQLVQRCQNDYPSTTLTKGTVVHITGSTSSDTPRVTIADWTNDNLSANTLGLVAEDIVGGGTGYVIVQGILKEYDTNGFNPGEMLYLSSSGQITNIKPSAPKHTVSIGQVIRKQSSNGSIYVSIQNGYELGELHDVLTNGKASGDLLVWDSSIPAWKNSTTLSGSYNFANTQILDVSSSTTALRVTQRGSGDVLRVEDSTNPDTTPFLIRNDGAVVIGRQAPYISATLTVQGNVCSGYNTATTYVDDFSHAEGYSTIAYGPYTHAEGSVTQARADNSHAEGEDTITYGTGSHSEGVLTRTFGDGAHSEGLSTIASGNYSHAEGYQTKTISDYSHTEGYQTTASADYQHVQGKYNATSSTALMLVGNGTSDIARSNILEVYDNRLVISGSVSASAGNSFSGSFIGNGSGLTNLPSPPIAFSPIDVGSSDQAPTATTTQYYYQTVAGATMTISKAKVWGFSGSDTVLFGIYRGSLGGTLTLIGQGSATCNVGPNEITLTPQIGQNLSVTSGENLVVGMYPSGTSWRTVYRSGISDVRFGIEDTTNITTMPATPSGTASAIRFACTIY